MDSQFYFSKTHIIMTGKFKQQQSTTPLISMNTFEQPPFTSNTHVT